MDFNDELEPPVNQDLDENVVPENQEKPRSKIPFYILGGVVAASLLWTGYQYVGGTETEPDPSMTATTIPTVIGSAEPTEEAQGGEFKDGVYVDSDDPNNENFFPRPVPDDDPTFTSMEEPPKSVEERAFPEDEDFRDTQAPETLPWEDTVEDFANAWGNVDVSKEKWLSNIRPHTTDRAYELLEYTEIRGLEKRTVNYVEELGQDATGFTFKVHFKEEGAKPMNGSVIMDQNDMYKWKIDVISEEG